jgi:cobalamin-dependent methionine synthase I
VSGGLSNVSFSFRENDKVCEAMHSASFFHAIKAGMNIEIVNPAMLGVLMISIRNSWITWKMYFSTAETMPQNAS